MTVSEYEALERWAIMTVEGGVSETDAIRFIQEKYGLETARKIWQEDESMGFTMKGYQYREVKNLRPGDYKAKIARALIEKSTDRSGFEVEQLAVYFTFDGIGEAVPNCKRYASRPEHGTEAEKWDEKFSRFVKSFKISGNPSAWIGRSGTVSVKTMSNGRAYIDFPETFAGPDDAAFEDANFAPDGTGTAPAQAPVETAPAPAASESFPEDIPGFN